MTPKSLYLFILCLFHAGTSQNLSCLTSGINSTCTVSGPLDVNVTAGSDATVSISTACNVRSVHSNWTTPEGLNITGGGQSNYSSIFIMGENAIVGSSLTYTTQWCDANNGLLTATVSIAVIAPDVCAEDVQQCPNGSFVTRETGLGCRFRPCECGGSSCFCINNNLGALICVREARQGEVCHPTWGPFYDNSTCVDGYSCASPVGAGFGSPGVCLPLVCGGSTCLCSLNNAGETICVRRAQFGEPCKPSLGPFQPNSTCEDGEQCVLPPNAFPGASGVCTPTDCGGSSCLCTPKSTGELVCVRRAREGETCNPSLGPFQANSTCEDGFSCISPPGVLGSSGVCMIVNGAGLNATSSSGTSSSGTSGVYLNRNSAGSSAHSSAILVLLAVVGLSFAS